MTQLFVHCVWGTWKRTPWLVGPVQETAFRVITSKCLGAGAQVIALNGIEDHLHLLIKMPPTLTVTKLLADSKGASSHAINQAWPHDVFKWQESYGAFSVSESGVAAVRRYIMNQEQHHHGCKESHILDPTPS